MPLPCSGSKNQTSERVRIENANVGAESANVWTERACQEIKSSKFRGGRSSVGGKNGMMDFTTRARSISIRPQRVQILGHRLLYQLSSVPDESMASKCFK